MRGSRISASICRGSLRGSRPPMPETSMLSSLLMSRARQVPYFFLIFSASAWGVLKPIEISLVRLLPPKASTNVCLIFFPENTARSVVPPPKSSRAVPSCFSSSVSTASPDARDSRTISETSSPDRLAHFTMLWAEATAPVTM